MRRVLFLFLAVGLAGCTKEPAVVKVEKPRSRRDIPVELPTKLKPKDASTSAKSPKDKEPDKPAAYTFGDLVTALQEDAKAKNYQGRLDARDPRIFRPDARHARIQNILADRYMTQTITLESLLKLRDELCKANNLKPAEVDKFPLDEIADAFDKGDKSQ